MITINVIQQHDSTIIFPFQNKIVKCVKFIYYLVMANALKIYLSYFNSIPPFSPHRTHKRM